MEQFWSTASALPPVSVAVADGAAQSLETKRPVRCHGGVKSVDCEECGAYRGIFLSRALHLKRAFHLCTEKRRRQVEKLNRLNQGRKSCRHP